jgi:hypothetical protein
VATTGVFSGIFTVVIGGLADGVGRVRIARIGFSATLIISKGAKILSHLSLRRDEANA